MSFPRLHRLSSLRVAFLLAAVVCSGTAAERGLELTLPARCYAVPELPMSIYFDNIVLTERPEELRFEVRSNIGRTESTRWTVTPRDSDVGEHRIHVLVKGTDGTVKAEAHTTLQVAPRDAGKGRAIRLLIVGDSLTNATIYPNEIARLLEQPGNPKWTMLGTHRPANAKPNVAHEGYGGWTWANFLSRFEPAPPPPKPGTPVRRSTSPFVFADAAGQGTLDLPRYFREHCGGQPPDVITFLLGINDCFRAKPDDPADIERTITIMFDNADLLLAAFKAAHPKVTLAVGLTTPPNAREAGFVASYKGNYHRWGWKRIQHRIVQRMIEHYGGRENSGIVLVPTELNLDPVNGYPENNGVHPNPTGYAQIGASFYAWLKDWLSQQK